MNRFAKPVIILASVVGILAFLNRQNPDWMVTTFLPVALLSILFPIFYSPHARDFVRTHPKLLLICGWSFAAASLVVAILAGIVFPDLNAGQNENVFTIIMVTGIFVGIGATTLPRSIARYDRTVAQIKIPQPKTASIFGVREGLTALGNVIENPVVFVKTALPWAFLMVVIPSLTLQYSAYATGRIHSPFQLFVTHTDADIVMVIFAWLLPFTAVLLVAVPMFLTIWYRWILQGWTPRGPFVALDRPFWRLFYVMFLATIFMNTMTRMMLGNSKDLAKLFHTANVLLVGHVLQDLVLFLTLLGGSLYSLVLPAIAVDDRNIDMMTSVRAVRPHWGAFIAGGTVAVAPFLAARWAVGHFVRSDAGFSIGTLLLTLAQQVLLFAMIAALAIYLSRAYQRLKQTEQADMVPEDT